MAYKIGQMEDFFTSQSAYFQTFILSTKGIYLILAFLLLPLNLLFEALKWREATKGVAKISILKSIKGIVTGQALNLILPANLGHFAGRLVNLEEAGLNKIQVISLVSVCQAAQMSITFFAFLLGAFGLGHHFFSFEINHTHVLLSIIIGSLILVLLFQKLQKQVYFQDITKGFRLVKSKQALLIFLFSLLRYLIFSTQFILVLYFLNVDQSWEKLAMVLSLVFMAKSLMPSFNFLSDLGVREFAALLFLPTIGLPESVVIAGSLWVWSINIFLPSLLGTFILLKTKLNYLFC